MSESVWYEQVDTAFKQFLQEHILIENEPVKVVIRKPDDDFSKEEYPLISVYCLFDRFSQERYSPDLLIISRDEDTKKTVVEDSAVPYDLYYQLDFWSSLQSDMNDMTLQWKSLVKKWFNLPLLDMSGNQRSSFVLSMNDFKKADLLNKGKRLFHSFGTYRVYVELDEKVQTEMPMVIEKGIDVSKIPKGG